MDVHTSDEINVPNGDFDSLQTFASSEDTMLITEKPGEILTRVELDLACFSEKLVNVNVLVMHVAMRESDFEAFVSDHDPDFGDSALKALEFDFLSGILDLEIGELDSFMSNVLSEINDIREFVYTYKHLGGPSLEEIEDKIRDSEESLKQSMDQVSEIKIQSAKFQRILSSFSHDGQEGGDHGADIREKGDFFDLNEKVKMQTAEQQRHFLRMLEKSLARELDLEKKVSELKQIDEEMKLKLQSSKQEALSMDEEALVIWQRLLEAENASEVLMGISKETLKKLGSEIENLKETTSKAGTRAEKAEGEWKFLHEKNTKLNEDLVIALASAEASEEKQVLLYDTINDMENIIGDLKSRVSRAEIRAEGVEENCIKLSETNAELNDEISFLRSRLEKLEGSLRNYEETKIATAKDIGIRTKVITDLVMQLAFERERLHHQISSLRKENKILSHQTGKDPLGKEERNERSDVSTTSFEMGKMANNREAELETIRNIDPRQINYKYALVAVLALVFSVLAGVWVNRE